MLCILLLAAACHRDEGAVTLTMSVESMSGGGKMTLNENVSSWDTGDSVWVNGTAYAVSTDGGSTSVTVPYSDNGYHAVFPARIARNGGSEIVLPAEYHYRTNANGQLLDMPLVAACENSTLLFKHITGALMVKLRNDNGYSLSMDSIIVSSDRYALSGTRDTASARTPQLGAGNNLSVSLCFDRQELTLNSGDSAYVMIPIAAVDSDNHFTVTVRSHHEGTRYTATKTQSKGGSLSSNTLAYATMALDGTQRVSPLFDKAQNQYIYYIYTAEDFKNMVTAINSNWNFQATPYSSAQFTIMNDIDMSGITIEPISGYTGSTFTGGGKTISNLTIASTKAICSLFDTVHNGTSIQNLTLQGVQLISNGNSAIRKISPLIGHASGSNSISKINVNLAKITINNNPSGDIYFGGIVASADAATTFLNCHISGNVVLNSNAQLHYGGILGYFSGVNAYELQFISCSTNQTDTTKLSATSTLYAGGVVGYTRIAQVHIDGHNCILKLYVENSNTLYAGGLIARLNNTNSSFTIGNTPNVAGFISYNNTPNTAYIGTLYGSGKMYTAYGFSPNDGYTTTLAIPNNIGSIHTGNPSYYQ